MIVTRQKSDSTYYFTLDEEEKGIDNFWEVYPCSEESIEYIYDMYY